MLLKTLNYKDKRTGWTLQNLEFDPFNLLVGASGVGKTRILRAIRQVRLTSFGPQPQSISFADADTNAAISFTVGFEHEGQGYTWEFESAPASSEELAATPQQTSSQFKALVTREKLTSTAEGVLVERSPEGFLFRGKQLPQLNRSATALALIDEPVLQRARRGLALHFLDEQRPEASGTISERLAEALLTGVESLEMLRAGVDISAIVKAFVLQERFPEHFAHLRALFIDVFPSVEDITITKRYSEGPQQERDRSILLSFEMKEHGVDVRIPGSDFSSGMLRTLTQLIDLWLAPAGTVVLIDEFENSLGVNCMGPLTEFIQSRASELQFIITSHHPYIINKIPKSYWKVVRRKGSVVRVTPAAEIRALQGTSAQDDFTRLLNSPEFEEGLA